MERINGTSDDDRSYTYVEVAADRFITNRFKNWFPPEAVSVLEESVKKIEAIEGVKFTSRQLVYFGSHDRCIGVPGDGVPKYVRIVQGGNVEWYITDFRVESPEVCYFPKDIVSEFAELQKKIDSYDVLDLKISYRVANDTDQSIMGVFLNVKRNYIELVTNKSIKYIGTLVPGDEIGEHFAQEMQNFINNKEYLNTMKAGKTLTKKSDRPQTTESDSEKVTPTEKRLAELLEMDRLDEIQYTAMLEEERNQVLAEIERREASDLNYQRPDWIPQNEKSSYYDTNIDRQRYVNEESFQRELHRNFREPRNNG